MRPHGTVAEVSVDSAYRPEAILRPNVWPGALEVHVVQHVATGTLWAKDVHLDGDGHADGAPPTRREVGDWYEAASIVAREVSRVSACVPDGPIVTSDPGEDDGVDGVVRAVASAPPREPPLHVIDQSGQPYGSVRRCCNACGLMVHPGMRFVDSMAEWRASRERRCLGESA